MAVINIQEEKTFSVCVRAHVHVQVCVCVRDGQPGLSATGEAEPRRRWLMDG